MALKKTAQYKDLRFRSKAKFEAWLEEHTVSTIELKDNGQDLLILHVDKEGEIINSNAQQQVWLGKFVNPDLVEGGELQMFPIGNNKDWNTMDFVAEKITKGYKS